MRRPSLPRIIGLAILGLMLWIVVDIAWVSPIRDLALVEIGNVPASTLPDQPRLSEAFEQRGVAIWRLTLTGSSHWIGEVRDRNMNTYPIVTRCDQPDLELFALGPYVDGRLVADWENPPPQPAAATARYTIYLAETGRYNSQKDPNAHMPDYDLRTQRLDLCLRIAGGSMMGAYGKSNEVRFQLGGKP